MNEPLTYQMGVVVGQHISQIKQDVNKIVDQAVDDMNQKTAEAIQQVNGDYAALDRKIRRMKLNNLLGLGI